MRSGATLGALAASLALAASGALPGGARAEVPVEAFGLLPSTTQAGGHPDLQVGFVLRTGKSQQVEEGLNSACDCENARFVTVHAPPGLVGSPASQPRCTAAQFASQACPVDSQVGVVEAGVQLTPESAPAVFSPVYNMVPRTGEAGLLAFSAAGAPIFETFGARTDSDYGLEARVSVPEYVSVRYSDQVLWGVPADPSHDALRFRADGSRVGAGNLCDENGVLATPSPEDLGVPSGPASATRLCNGVGQIGAASNSPPVPFTENPTACGVTLEASVDVLAYDETMAHGAAPFPATTGCDQLSFNPSLAARPTTTAADSPAGIDVDLSVPQYESPTVPSPSEIRDTEMTLPEGFAVNPSAADGKSACTGAEAAFGTTDAANCPETSKIGTLEIHTALLPGPLTGYLYLGQPLPGNRYRVFLVADGFDVHVKLAGKILADEQTGRLTVLFEDLPQTPFSDFTLHVFGSERGALVTPAKCGAYGIATTFTPWDEALGRRSSKTFFTIDRGPNGTPCPGATRPFGAGFQAGSAGNAAGAHSPFAVDLQRPDGDQFLAGLSVRTPPGFAANLNGIPYCPQAAIDRLSDPLYAGLAEIAAPACPPDSQIGTVLAGAGAGSRPFHAPGKVYLAGPYRGAPLSLVVVVPAVSGPYDLGNVAVRAAIEVDPETARVSTVSDPLPQILEGIPLRARSVRVNVDRPDFALNPTNCSPLAVEAEISGDEGATSDRSVPYQVANCANLPFAPRLSLRLRGGTKRSSHPSLRAVLSAPAGEANLAGAQVTLPRSEYLENAHIRTICTRVQFNEGAGNGADCPAGSVYGRARAITPILDAPLEGQVYLRASSHPLPDLVMALHGQVDFDAVARIDSVNGGIRSTFESIPDVPVSKVVLEMQGAAKGLLVNSTDLCKGTHLARIRFSGQNGRAYAARVPLRSSCVKRRRRRARVELRRAREAGRR